MSGSEGRAGEGQRERERERGFEITDRNKASLEPFVSIHVVTGFCTKTTIPLKNILGYIWWKCATKSML